MSAKRKARREATFGGRGGRGLLACTAGALLLVGLSGCAAIHNQFVEDGPSRTQPHDSASVADIRERYEMPAARSRNLQPTYVSAESGAVYHGPLYFEDPFEDKGHGREDYRLGWEDGVAMPYGLARYLLNGIALPGSMVVTWPWTRMESDGELSEQLLGYDHDATPVNALFWPKPAEGAPSAEE